MQNNNTCKKGFAKLIYLLLIAIGIISCKKLVSVSPPINTITTTQVFSNDVTANAAIAGIYSSMINLSSRDYGNDQFSNGYTTLFGGMSSDELVFYYGSALPTYYEFNNNSLLSSNGIVGTNFLAPAYSDIYNANAVIEGIAASTSVSLHDSVRNELTGEAKFIRAFCYFYLTNLFGDVPLALSVDFNQINYLSRTPQSQVYAQIIQDLIDAQSALPSDFSVGSGERIRPNKWAATALLARVYLYTDSFANAVTQATAVINNSSLFGLDTLNGIFLANSTEAIWQLQQNTSNNGTGNATIEGYWILPNPLTTGSPIWYLSSQLLASFETGDQRKTAWIDSTNDGTGTYYYPFKYKIGSSNYEVGGTATEYYMMLRLAEQYLIRAEAEAALGQIASAIADLNVIRTRAGLSPLSGSLTQTQVMAAVVQERRIELLAEWGHRWLDLKRWGTAVSTLDTISYKAGNINTNQLVWPIPFSDLKTDPNLTQNAGY